MDFEYKKKIRKRKTECNQEVIIRNRDEERKKKMEKIEFNTKKTKYNSHFDTINFDRIKLIKKKNRGK